MKTKRRHIGVHISSAVLEFSNYRCFYCGAEFNTDNPLTLDHIVPLCSGGTNQLNNLVAACKVCNREKGAKPIGAMFEGKRHFEEAVRVYLGLSTFELAVLRVLRRIRKMLGLVREIS
jgi:5-methylcytosine-specific restriction protein A